MSHLSAYDAALDSTYMKRAIGLAKKGIARTHPNPRVGAVVVKNGKLIGEGWHHCAGEAHAEVNALQDAGEQAVGACVYVSLEPCCKHGRTPPCTEAILKAGIKRVVFASSDPNPNMAGGSLVLKKAGIEVIGGVMSVQADALNTAFFHYIATGLPYVISKAAISLDGKLATYQHDSQWITGAKARRHAHRVRAECDAIVVGAGTLKDDNPSLTVRHARLKGKPPLRVVIAKRTPRFFAECKLLNNAAESRMYVYDASNEHTASWCHAGMAIIEVVDLQAALRHLAESAYLQVLMEGGGQLHAAFLEAGLAHELLLYQAPLLIGGTESVNFWHGLGAPHMNAVVRLLAIQRRRLGDDVMIRGKLFYPSEM
ncbi:MAG: bifunctional diaminohydroxyphosphoribosylaminopyrimidine deaminase/5-amino-6-(5-phosphoribosylamino)uracil reductase RibD [Mariprofundaceae bacterium]|nr:bifunctional diaminohydroxyphosphoribosylaminopyrimidine deaminase/5-amino-6-(5-phosphoribosylamino)uracil reductase RibD [Mariprofundaceae bacterium]